MLGSKRLNNSAKHALQTEQLMHIGTVIATKLGPGEAKKYYYFRIYMLFFP